MPAPLPLAGSNPVTTPVPPCVSFHRAVTPVRPAMGARCPVRVAAPCVPSGWSAVTGCGRPWGGADRPDGPFRVCQRGCLIVCVWAAILEGLNDVVTLKNDDVVEGRGDGAVAAAGSARGLVDGLVSSGALDSLFERIDKGDVELTGDGGLIPELVRAALERGLDAEMTSHPGYASGDREGKTASGSTNSRNGSYPKTLATEVGPVTIQVPRDREGSFTPRLVPKCSRRLGGLDDMIVSLYAGGMTVRDIQHHLAKTVGTELSHETISSVTDAVADAVLEWQERPLDEFYPVMYLDAIRVKVRDGGRVVSKAAHIAIGVDMEGLKHVPGIWIQDSEGSSFWANVCAQMANRGVWTCWSCAAAG